MMPSQSAASSSSSIAQGPLSLEDVLAHAQQLPSLPDVILKLSRMLEEPDVTAEELGRLIQLDPQLTAQMLRTCNSAYFGLNRKVTHMKEAVALMGQKALKSMVYAILSKKMLGQEVKATVWVKGSCG